MIKCRPGVTKSDWEMLINGGENVGAGRNNTVKW